MAYPKTGQRNASARIGVTGMQGGPTRWLSIPGDPANHYLASLAWASNSTELIVQQFNRVQNTNRVMIADAATGRVRTVLTETDPAWLESENPLPWSESGTRFIWLSERSGWRHAYSVDRGDGSLRPVTTGEFDVLAIEAVDDRNGWLYYAASHDNPTQRYLYRIRLDGGESQRLTPAGQPGTHRYDISPDARWAIHTYSTFTNPPVTDLIQLPEHTRVRVLEENKALRERIAALHRPDCTFFRIGIGGGVELDGWMIRPPGFDAARRYPVLFYVYGETGGQTVLDVWPGKTGLWHWMLAQEGYLVMSIDNRGTPAPRGREWRKIVHRQIGILASADQAAALRALLERWEWVDPERIGIWGWSGGGSMTLNALFRYPGLYHLGMSIAPVPNQRLYDTIYQERYMGLPEDNPGGYRRASPVTYAHQLEGDLLLVHGTGDDNVHYQGMEALINELIAYNKPFDLMIYPNRRHAISEGHNTRLHLFTLLTRYLCEKLPAEVGTTQVTPVPSGN
jgi:dipeptidyl-peptidase-4